MDNISLSRMAYDLEGLYTGTGMVQGLYLQVFELREAFGNEKFLEDMADEDLVDYIDFLVAVIFGPDVAPQEVFAEDEDGPFCLPVTLYAAGPREVLRVDDMGRFWVYGEQVSTGELIEIISRGTQAPAWNYYPGEK